MEHSELQEPLLGIIQPLHTIINSTVRIEFKVEVEVQVESAIIAAMVQRAKLRASRIRRSPRLADSPTFAAIQSADGVSINTIEETWSPLLAKLQIFSNLAQSIAEVSFG